MPNPRFKPRHFFLNERHELPVEQREGFGGVRYYANVDWAGKGRRIASSLASVEQHARASHDPLSGKRFFILAAPETGLQRQPGPKAKSQALVDETVDFRGEHARVFEKLGIDFAPEFARRIAGDVEQFRPRRFAHDTGGEEPKPGAE